MLTCLNETGEYTMGYVPSVTGSEVEIEIEQEYVASKLGPASHNARSHLSR